MLKPLCLLLCAKATHKSGQTAQLMNCKGVQRDRVGDWPTGESEAIPPENCYMQLPSRSQKASGTLGKVAACTGSCRPLLVRRASPLSCHLNSRALACSIWAGLRPLLPSLLRLHLTSVLRCIGSTTKTMIQVYRAQPGGDA